MSVLTVNEASICWKGLPSERQAFAVTADREDCSCSFVGSHLRSPLAFKETWWTRRFLEKPAQPSLHCKPLESHRGQYRFLAAVGNHWCDLSRERWWRFRHVFVQYFFDVVGLPVNTTRRMFAVNDFLNKLVCWSPCFWGTK